MTERQASGPAALATATQAGNVAAGLAAPATSRTVVLPQVHELSQLPNSLPAGTRLLATPRARLTVYPRSTDPMSWIRQSGRLGCSFSFRSIAAGLIEFLLPSSGLFQRGEPLFRLYDPEILQDLAAAERAMQSGDVSPLMIARAAARAGLLPPPRGMRSVETRQMYVPSGPMNFPDPTGSGAVPRLVRGNSNNNAVSHAMPEPVPQPRPQVTNSSASDTPRRATIQQSAPAQRNSSSEVEPTSTVPKIDLGPYEDAVSQAKSAVKSAADDIEVCEEDYDAKSRLVELGALAANAQEAAADKLTRAQSRKQDAEARLKMAQDRLSSERERAERVADNARKAAQMVRESQPEDVQVIRGSQNSPEAVNVEVVRGNPTASSTAKKAASRNNSNQLDYRQPGATQARGSRPVGPPALPPGLAAHTPGRFAFQEPARQRRSNGMDYRSGPLMSRNFTGTPQELKRLSELRWTEYQAPSDGYVLQQTVADGSLVKEGQELVKVINTQWARAYFSVERADAGKFRAGTVVTVSFDDYPGVVFEGWINTLQGADDGVSLRAEVIVFCREGYYGTDAFATLQWLALATPLESSGEKVAPVQAVTTQVSMQDPHGDPRSAFAMVPPEVWAQSVQRGQTQKSENSFEGQLQLVELPQTQAPGQVDTKQKQVLAKLRKWRDGFSEGMTRTLFRDDVVLTYPRNGEIRRAIERMATRQVTNVPNRCARTVREALGWGLGDAHVWAYQLPSRGYYARSDGYARPGDILVWPFTYPPRGSQHIGIAVQQNGRLMLLSNLNGDLGTVPIQPGYLAFYKP